MKLTFHLIGNAHLDPVWLWDWREGLCEGLQTCRTILDLMDENKDLTFIRGESIIYEHIEKHDPATFKRIAQYVKSGRWDCVGGTVIQPDTNLPMTEVFARHFEHGLRYFQSRFNKRVRVAWAADSFGHAEGLPEILAAAGMTGFAFSRPASNIVPIAKPAFWWKGPGGSRVMAYRAAVGWYGCEREELVKRLDQTLVESQKLDLENVGLFYGLGNHGGGPTRRHIAEILAWAKIHPEVNVQFSGLHKLFDSLYAEVKRKGDDFIPSHRGEMNFVLRGCYSSVAKFKFPYRKTEAQLSRAEKTQSAIRGMGASPMHSSKQEHGPGAHATMEEAWYGLLFNSFHDILPGSSIERAFDDQIAWLGGCFHTAQRAEFAALADLAGQINTRVKPVKGDIPTGVSLLVWNPHPHEFVGPVEVEATLDYRPIWKYNHKPDELPIRLLDARGKAMPFQVIPTEHSSMVDFPWRKRVVLPMKLPAMGWNVIEMAWVEGATPPKIDWPVNAVEVDHGGEIDNGIYRVSAKPGHSGVHIFHKGRSIFGTESMRAVTIEDPWGSWGGMAEEPDSIKLQTVRDQWKITKVQMMERGPLRASVWVRMQGGNSRLDLTFSVSKDRAVVDIAARVMWDERSARLKLIMPNVGEDAEFDVPGASVRRDPNGEVPGGRWVRVRNDTDSFGFASNAIYNFDQKGDNLQATIVRATRYANDVKTGPDEIPWRPAVDVGELRFNAIITPGDAALPMLAEQLEQPPVAMLVPSKKGPLPRVGSLMSLSPASFKLLALKPASDGKGLILRVQETAGKSAEPKLTLHGKRISLSRVKAYTIATWRLTKNRTGWKAIASNIAEE